MGIHSGDSACVIPPYSLPDHIREIIRQNTYALARELNVIGLMNIQFAVKDDLVYILEVNPRSSRTVPFVSKATGIPWAKIAAQVMVGKKLQELGITSEVSIRHFAVKEAVFPFNRFPGVDPILGPEMKSTGEVMGIDEEFGTAFIKTQLAAGQRLPKEGAILISVNDRDRKSIIGIAKQMEMLGFKLLGTHGTARYLKENGVELETVLKLGEGRPNILDLIKNSSINLVINTPSGRESAQDQITIRRSAIDEKVGVLSGLLVAVQRFLHTPSGSVLTESTYHFFIATLVLFGWRAFRHGKFHHILLFGFFTSLAYLTRPEGIGFLFVFSIWVLLINPPEGKRVWKKRVGIILLAIFCFLLFSSPYLIHLRKELGGWQISKKVFLSTRSLSEEEKASLKAAGVKEKINLHALAKKPLTLLGKIGGGLLKSFYGFFQVFNPILFFLALLGWVKIFKMKSSYTFKANFYILSHQFFSLLSFSLYTGLNGDMFLK